jgi:MYND finger
MYFNNYIKDKRNQACLDLGFKQWTTKFYPRLKSYYKCALPGCRHKENAVICSACENSFYCSEECRVLDTANHMDICAVTNTRDMLFVDSFLGWKLNPILSMIAMAKYKQVGPGVLNVRSYSNIWDFRKIPNVNKIRNARKELGLFITYVPLGEWKERYLRSGLTIPGAVRDNPYRKKMIVNFHIEGMNKPQLHCLPLLDLVKSEPDGLHEFMSDPMSRINTFQVSFDAR